MCGTVVLKDTDVLQSFCKDGLTLLSIMVVTSIDQVHKHLSHSSRHTRQEALKAFAQLAPKGNRGAIAAVSELLSDAAPDVRISALKALSSIAAGGDDRTISLMVKSLQ